MAKFRLIPESEYTNFGLCTSHVGSGTVLHYTKKERNVLSLGNALYIILSLSAVLRVLTFSLTHMLIALEGH